MSNMFDLAIVGGGATGYTAAMYAGRLGLKVIIVAAEPGGLIVTVESIENFPGFKMISGYDLFTKIQEQARIYPIVEKSSTVLTAKTVADGNKAFFALQTNKDEIVSQTILLATGALHRKLPLPEIEKFEHRGVHYCALCDAFAYKQKIVAVVGAGDAAVREAIELAQVAKKVFLIARSSEIKAELVNRKRLEATAHIEVILNANIIKIIGDSHVKKIELDRPYEGQKKVTVDVIFLAIGRIPNTALVAQLGVALNSQGEIIIDRNSATNVPGVYAAGDVVDTHFKQLITGCAEGVTAVHHIFNYLVKHPI